jgi:hypothetical protein
MGGLFWGTGTDLYTIWRACVPCTATLFCVAGSSTKERPYEVPRFRSRRRARILNLLESHFLEILLRHDAGGLSVCGSRGTLRL